MRLIDADAFKEYIRKKYKEVEHEFKTDYYRQLAKQITEAFCLDIDEMPSAQPEPHWIPCSPETMPETEERVLVTCEHLNCYGKSYRYICKAFHVDRYTMESTVDWDEGCDEYREEDDKFYVLEGWYEVIHNWGDYGSVKISEDKVVAWMPLPEPWRG